MTEFTFQQIVEFNPETGSKRPYEVYTLRFSLNGELLRKGFRASYSTLEAAIKAWPTSELKGRG